MEDGQGGVERGEGKNGELFGQGGWWIEARKGVASVAALPLSTFPVLIP